MDAQKLSEEHFSEDYVNELPREEIKDEDLARDDTISPIISSGFQGDEFYSSPEAESVYYSLNTSRSSNGSYETPVISTTYSYMDRDDEIKEINISVSPSQNNTVIEKDFATMNLMTSFQSTQDTIIDMSITKGAESQPQPILESPIAIAGSGHENFKSMVPSEDTRYMSPSKQLDCLFEYRNIIENSGGEGDMDLPTVSQSDETFLVSDEFNNAITAEDWEVLATKNSGKTTTSKWGRESMYKFDPLYNVSPSGTPKSLKLSNVETPMCATPQEFSFLEELNNNRDQTLFEKEKLEDSEKTQKLQMLETELTEERKKYEQQMILRDEQIKKLDKELAKALTIDNGRQQRILAEYEDKMYAGAREVEDWKMKAMAMEREKAELARERDQAIEDLRNVESAFSDVHSKYERIKGILKNSRRNQELLEDRDLEMQARLSETEARILEIQNEVRIRLTKMNADFEIRIRSAELDTTRLRAQLRKAEMKNETLEHDVKQKNSEILKLSALCDELINQKLE